MTYTEYSDMVRYGEVYAKLLQFARNVFDGVADATSSGRILWFAVKERTDESIRIEVFGSQQAVRVVFVPNAIIERSEIHLVRFEQSWSDETDVTERNRLIIDLKGNTRLQSGGHSYDAERPDEMEFIVVGLLSDPA